MDPDAPLIQAREGVILRLHVQPGARRDQLVGIHDGRLKLAVTAPPDQGKANAAVIRLVADAFSVPASQLSVLRGLASRRKDVAILGHSLTQMQQMLARLLDREESSQEQP